MHSTIKTIHFTINTIKYVYFNQKHVVVESSRNKNEYIFEIFDINFSNFYFFFPRSAADINQLHNKNTWTKNYFNGILESRRKLKFWLKNSLINGKMKTHYLQKRVRYLKTSPFNSFFLLLPSIDVTGCNSC